MIEFVKILCTAIVGGVLLNGASIWLDSDFLHGFLHQNLIVLLTALMAINGTTMSVVVTKLQEILECAEEADFQNTVREMKISIYEQIWLIISALIIQIIAESKSSNGWPFYINFALSSALAGIFVYAIYILYDTAKSVFVLLGNANLRRK